MTSSPSDRIADLLIDLPTDSDTDTNIDAQASAAMSAALRKRAEKALANTEVGGVEALSSQQMQRLIHELRVHHVELTMQNDELRRAQDALLVSRARYVDLYDLAPIGYLTLDQEGRIQNANVQAAKLLQTPRQQLIDQMFTAFVFADDQDIHYHRRRALVNATDVQAYELRMHRSDGTRFWASLQATRTRDLSSGAPIFQLTMNDISEARRVAKQRSDFETRLHEAQKLDSLAVLTGGIAHDFNNFLHGILCNARLVLADPTLTEQAATPVRDTVEDIVKAATRAKDLAQQMLAYSGTGQLIMQTLFLADLITEMVSLLEAAIPKKIRVVLELATAADANIDIPPVTVDATQMRQIIMNLVLNAAEAIGDNTGVITVRHGVSHRDAASPQHGHIGDALPEGDYVYVEVSDTGVGMDQATVARIFEPFFTTKISGRGLGLAALIGIVRAHRGAVEVHSEPGRGTTFRVLLSAAGGSVTRADTSAPDEPEGSLAGKTVLLVDDEQIIRAMLQRLLEQAGVEVVTAVDGTQAVALFEASPDRFDCVVLDLLMPGLDGTQTLHEMRALRPEVRAIMTSGYAEQVLRERYAGVDAVRFLQKPYEPDALLASLHDLLA